MDPRLAIIEDRLAPIRRIIAVASGKGGVGKSIIATSMALALSRIKNYSCGLLDLDFHGPSCHIILGVDKLKIKEDKGIIPPVIEGIKFMSITQFSEERPVALRGKDVSNAIIELLAITRWGDLDYLIVDLPPGMGDEALDTIRLMKNKEFLVVTTPSKLSIGVVKKLISFLKTIDATILGIVENMVMNETNIIQEIAKENGIKYLGKIYYDPKLEDCIGSPQCLMSTKFMHNLLEFLENI